jgi:hypothetical protein
MHREPKASSGPNTPAGKFEVSKNALTHGLTAANIERFPENVRAAYECFLAQHMEEWQPGTLQEEVYVQRLAFAQFQSLRAQSLLAAAQEIVLQNPEDDAAHKRLATYSRHYRALDRSAQTALKELRTFIADRIVSAEASTEIPLPDAFPHHLLTDRASTRQPLDRTALRFAYSNAAAPSPLSVIP